MRDWVTNVENTFYIIGTVAGPHPYPMMVRDFNSVVGRELRTQMPEAIGRQPDAILACVGGGSNAIGAFYPYIEDKDVRLIGVEAGGLGLASGKHAATLCAGKPGVFARQPHLPDPGRERPDHRNAFDLGGTGLSRRRPGACMAERDSGRAEYVSITDDEALNAFHTLTRMEGIMPALESAHAVAHAMKLAPTLGGDKVLLVNLFRPWRQGHEYRRRTFRPEIVKVREGSGVRGEGVKPIGYSLPRSLSPRA